MAGPAPWVTRPVARLRGAAPRRRGAGRDHHVPTLRAPYVHQPRAAARARAGGAAARGRHAAGPGPGRRSPALGPHLITPPQPADGRLWVLPRPALPEVVADALYGEPDLRDSVAVGRLRAMVDTLNRQLDSLQIARKPPSWTANVAGEKFGIDGSNIYIGPIRIPTAALALLGNLLPQGNYDESRRARQLADMRADLLQAARRAETMDQFKKYVKELRARKQAERDAQKRAKGDTTRARADTLVP